MSYVDRAQARFEASWPRRCFCGSLEQRSDVRPVEGRGGRVRSITFWVCAACGRDKGPAIQSPAALEREIALDEALRKGRNHDADK